MTLCQLCPFQRALGWSSRRKPHDSHEFQTPSPPPHRDALEGKGPQRRPHRRLDRRLEGVAEAVGGGYCRLQMPLKPALGVTGAVAGHRLGALEGGTPPPPMIAAPPPPPPLQPHALPLLFEVMGL